MSAPEQNQLTQPQPPSTDQNSWRATLARRLMRTMFFICIPAVLAASYYAIAEGDYIYLPIYGLIFLAMGVLAFWKRIHDNHQTIGLLVLLYLVVLLDYGTEGRGSLAPLFLATFAFTCALFFGRKGVIVALVIAILTMVFFAYAYTSGLLPDFLVSSKIVPGWISNSVMIVFIVSFISFSLDFVITEMLALLQKSQALSQTLEAERSNLEQIVTERTRTAETALIEAETAKQFTETQMWLSMGQTQLAEKMRGEQEIGPLANNIISHLCHYLEAQAGILYVAEGDRLQLAGGYAYVKRPGLKETLQFGEGLVGQAALENRPIVLDEISPETMVITSSLGESRPRQILIFPLSVDQQVVGIAELASLTPFSNQHQTFLSLAGENIAIGLLVAKAREQIANLLKNAQRQASELRAQEAELRAANEELQAQAESLMTKKK